MVKEARNWRHDSLWDRKGPGRRSTPEWGMSGSRNGGRRTESRRAKPQGLIGTPQRRGH